MTTLFWVAVGAFVGWNLPQPEYAKRIQAAIIEAWNKFVNKQE